MNYNRILPLVLLFAATSNFAQQPAIAGSANTASLTHLRTIGAACPLNMQATHGAAVPVGMNAISGREMEKQAPVSGLYQRIHLTVTNLQSHEIVSAQITAHGFSDKWKPMDLAYSSQAPDLAKTLDVVIHVKGNGNASSDLSLSRFTVVSSIDLNSITYADGGTWHASSPAACSVIPDSAMLVAATR
jgi:hypothetical protein